MLIEMIVVIGDGLRCKIVSEIEKAKNFIILVDEVTDCTNVDSFVNENMQIREEFIDFATVERPTQFAHLHTSTPSKTHQTSPTAGSPHLP